MVNIQPIPPLLCSTPPPIDFGDDEDLDSMPPSLDDMDDDFGGFLADGGIQNEEPLPSSRPPSVCDLPPISIYDGLIPLEETNFTKHTSLQSPDSKQIRSSKNVTEAFNFEVKNFTKDEKKELHEETKDPAKPDKTAEYVQETEGVSFKMQESEQSNQSVCTGARNHTHNNGLNKIVKDLNIEPVNDEMECIVKRAKETNMQNVVSVEDIEDDLSDDELYSPKTPKNFTETDNITDLFKIEEIKTVTTAGNILRQDSKIINSKSSECKDNNTSASFDNKNDNEFRSYSSNSFIPNQFDEPPPLSDDFNSIDIEVDDDFGDYADFQETHFVSNAVPVENGYINQYKSDLEINDMNGFDADDYTNCNDSQIDRNKLEGFGNLHSNNSSLIDKFVIKDEGNLGKNVITMQEFKNDKEDSLYTTKENCKGYKNYKADNESNQPEAGLRSYEDNSLSDLSEVTVTDDNEDFGNFEEFSCIPPGYENMIVNTTETKKENICKDDDGDNEFSDFANFESHQNVTTKSNDTHQSSIQDDVNQDEKANDDSGEDDDFGDFNTAEPIAITTAPSSLIVTTASQNINPQAPIIASNNLNERISKILLLMFNANENLAKNDSAEIRADKIQDIPFTTIDAAKALEYQWLNSDTRHSFIRSLGIDSRNILYGDNWNPSLPRFAANLSFNPLKPMKPVPSSNITGDVISVLESIPTASAETNRIVAMSGNIKKDEFDLDWKSAIAEERTIEAFNGNNMHAPIDAASSVPYISSNETQTAASESVAIFGNTFDNEGKLPRTPPISEMESVKSFTSPLPDVSLDMELSAPHSELEESTSSLNISEVVVTSTFSGSFKETHIYTPPKANDFEIKHAIATPPTSSSPTKSSPIDFDYEKAAMGVIINETVVKKEYRDVEYNPPFSMDSLSKSISPKAEFFETNSYINKTSTCASLVDNKKEVDREDEDANDDFSEFQSVSSQGVLPTTSKPLEVPKTTTVSHAGMILSPAILIPHAIFLENQKPKIEWGESTASINPEELARIEELFPEPKSLKSSNSSQKSTPTHQVPSAPSISATVANKELEGNINDDDDDWSDFVSVTVTSNMPVHRTGGNNNISTRSPAGTPFQQRSPIVTNKIQAASASNSNNDDEWSDFVSSAPPTQQSNTYRVPQFNSGAWQNANFYNNPLSMYHKGPLNIPTTAAVTHSAHKYLYNNNNYNVLQQPYPMANNKPSTVMANNQHQPSHNTKQQIHVMQNFSTASVPTPERLSAAATAAAKSNQFQSIGSAKVAPSIALIPDLGFVAPAIPTHTSFINSLPKPGINMKK